MQNNNQRQTIVARPYVAGASHRTNRMIVGSSLLLTIAALSLFMPLVNIRDCPLFTVVACGVLGGLALVVADRFLSLTGIRLKNAERFALLILLVLFAQTAVGFVNLPAFLAVHTYFP